MDRQHKIDLAAWSLLGTMVMTVWIWCIYFPDPRNPICWDGPKASPTPQPIPPDKGEKPPAPKLAPRGPKGPQP